MRMSPRPFRRLRVRQRRRCRGRSRDPGGARTSARQEKPRIAVRGHERVQVRPSSAPGDRAFSWRRVLTPPRGVRFDPNRRRTLSGPATEKLISPRKLISPGFLPLRQHATRPCDVASDAGGLWSQWVCALSGGWARRHGWAGHVGDASALKDGPAALGARGISARPGEFGGYRGDSPPGLPKTRSRRIMGWGHGWHGNGTAEVAILGQTLDSRARVCHCELRRSWQSPIVRIG